MLVSSIASRSSSPMGGWYHASKTALESIADILRQEVAGFGVQVGAVQPGVVRTPWHAATSRLIESTAGTPYEAAGSAIAAYHERSATLAMASDVATVTQAILTAAAAPRHRTRYLVGRGSRTATVLPRLVPDRTFDAMTKRQFGITTSRE